MRRSRCSPKATARITGQLADDDQCPGIRVVAWIACRQCRDVLARVRELAEPWDHLIDSADAYVIFPSQASYHAGAAALAALADAHS
ncbi:MAG: hypothetical protein J2P25_17810 [Nocardiopsaceae bacterium]|nr:hypothetical protein [Nocardiopsaceae bacterium]